MANILLAQLVSVVLWFSAWSLFDIGFVALFGKKTLAHVLAHVGVLAIICAFAVISPELFYSN